MIKQSKSKLTLILSGMLFAGIMFAACNGSGDTDKAAAKDSVTAAPAEAKKDSIPATSTEDTMKLKGNEKPTPEKP